jgi:hypothetical protein
VEPGDVETAALLAAAHGGGLPAAVLPVRRLDGHARFLCAFGEPEALSWLLVETDGRPVVERAEVRDAAEVVAMCETAEEAAAALVADDALPLLARARELAQVHGDAEAELAARATIEALEDLVEVVPGFRVAEPAYVDRIADRANLVGDRFDLLKEAAASVTARLSGAPGEPLEELAELLWDLVRLLARDGAPDRFREAMEAAIGAAGAFADDVETHYALGLEGPGPEEEEGT